MKIKIGETVYLQKYEIAHMMHDLNSFPDAVLQEIFGKGGDEIFFMSSPEDGYRFDCAFKNPKSVEWIMAQNWIVDYDEYTDKTQSWLKDNILHLTDEHKSKIDEFNGKDDDFRVKHIDEYSDKFKKECHMIDSLKILFSARNGYFKFVFPDGYQGTTTPGSTSITKKKKPGFFARLFHRVGAQ